MKTNNRPIIKVIEHTHYDYNACEMGYCDCPEVERQMNDKEYIKHLEKENKELKEQLRNKTVESDKHLAIATEIAVELEQTQDKILELVWHTIVDFELTNDITNEKETLAPHIVSLIVKKIKKGIEDEHK